MKPPAVAPEPRRRRRSAEATPSATIATTASRAQRVRQSIVASDVAALLDAVDTARDGDEQRAGAVAAAIGAVVEADWVEVTCGHVRATWGTATPSAGATRSAPLGAPPVGRVTAWWKAGPPSAKTLARLRGLAGLVQVIWEYQARREQRLHTEVAHATHRRVMATLGNFIHSLGTPLGAVKMAASTMREFGRQMNDHDRDELLLDIEDGINQVASLSGAITVLARMEAGDLSVTLEPHSLADLVETELARRTPRRGRPVIEFAPVEATVPADAMLACRAIGFILDRALASATSPIVVTMGIDRDRCRAFVEARYHGAPPRFDPTDASRDALGLDGDVRLAASQRILRAHGGALDVATQPGGVVALTLTLPVIRHEHD
ncbi:MAG: hypothetical protein NZ518_05500 [Dehalococcoidia bacterium]|nr:hypothetical protein [Dehalococcoidia bacterium]